MAKIVKKKFFEVDVPLANMKFEALANAVSELENKSVKLDITRQLRGKSVDVSFTIKLEDGKAVARPKKLALMPFFITHMLHAGVDYVEDSITADTLDSQVVIKPFMITRKKVSRAVKRTLRNSAKNWIIDYLKEKTDADVFQDILSNQLQKPLGLKLKKIYPLAICEIRIFEVKKSLGKKAEKSIGEIEVKKEAKEGEGFKEVKEEIVENIEIEEPEEIPKSEEKIEEKPKKKKRKSSKED